MTPLFFEGDEEMDEQFFPVLISASLDLNIGFVYLVILVTVSVNGRSI
jgi:hypothetical protein